MSKGGREGWMVKKGGEKEGASEGWGGRREGGSEGQRDGEREGGTVKRNIITCKQLCHVHSTCSSPDYAMFYYME